MAEIHNKKGARPVAAPVSKVKNTDGGVSGEKAVETSPSSGVVITDVRVRHFRCLRFVDVTLDSLTVLIGQNNSGKTSFLQALFAAIGAGQRSITSDDIFLNKTEVSAPKDRAVVIDILIRPTDDSGRVIDAFPQGSAWLELWGNGVVQGDDDNELVAIRTTFKWNPVKGEYALDRRFLKDWQKDSAKWEESKHVEKVPPVSAPQLEPIAFYLLDAKRDIAEDLRTRSSFWSKMVEEHGLTAEDVKRIENELSDINQDIVRSSGVFTHIQKHLRSFHETLSCDEDSIAITPLARHLRDLSRGMDVVLSTRGALHFPWISKEWEREALALSLRFGHSRPGGKSSQARDPFIPSWRSKSLRRTYIHRLSVHYSAKSGKCPGKGS